MYLNNVYGRCIHVYNMNSGETELGPDSRQVPTSFSKTFNTLKDPVIQLNKFKMNVVNVYSKTHENWKMPMSCVVLECQVKLTWQCLSLKGKMLIKEMDSLTTLLPKIGAFNQSYCNSEHITPWPAPSRGAWKLLTMMRRVAYFLCPRLRYLQFLMMICYLHCLLQSHSKL